MHDAHRRFHNAKRFLLTTLKRRVRAGGAPHLADLLLRLDYNDMHEQARRKAHAR